MLGHSTQMQEVRLQLSMFAPVRQSVLLRGETGTGKELAARALHFDSPRSGRLVPLNCGGNGGDDLAASKLFGHVRGAFTGAHRDYAGAFEQASDGTLFLDEVGELPLSQQVMLLRVLETRQLTPLGGEQERKVSARVVAATHRDLEGMVQRREFREDLYHRLRVLEVRLPPLRERRDDIEQLALHFAKRAAAELGHVVSVHPSALCAARSHGWLGNARELCNAVMRAAILGKGEISGQDLLPIPISAAADTPSISLPKPAYHSVGVDQIRRAVLEHGSRNKAARALGMPRSTLSAMLRRAEKQRTG